MTLAKKLSYITPSEYLEGEKISDVKHEYVDGNVYAMAGGSARHYRIIRNIGRLLENYLDDSNCEVFMADMKTKANEFVYYYPDVAVTCEEIDDIQDTIYNPTLIIEVLSPSTAHKDRREKLIAYKMIESLQEYAIVWQDEMRVELHRRNNDGWLTFFFTQTEDEVEFASVKHKTNVAEIYRGISFVQ